MRIAGLAAFVLSVSAYACGGGGGPNGSDQRSCNDGGSGNTINGSYCDGTPMNFTDVHFLTVSSALRIEYDNKIGTGGEEKTLQIILINNPMPNVDIFILQSGAQVRRLLADAQAPQDLTMQLDMKSKVNLSEYTGAAGSHISGMFAFLFMSGRTLNGKFDGMVENAMQ
jgi:hypothetical protein